MLSRRELLKRSGIAVGAAALTTMTRGIGPVGAQSAGRFRTIVLIVADDMRFDFRTVVANFAQGWIDCVNCAVETPLCGPGRVGLLRGTYSYRTGVTSNATTWRMVDTDTIATRIRAAGYRTVLSGKYLNDYPWDRGTSYVPPGWDVWFAAGSRNYRPGTQHPTDYIFGVAANQVRNTAATRPLFLYVAPQAPHLPAVPPARYANASPALPPVPTSLNEADISDKPAPYNSTPLLTPAQLAQVPRDRLQIGRSLLGVNDGITTLLSALADTGRLSNTAIFFTSDNGYMLGEHRLFKKGEPYEEPSHVPLLVRWPGSPGRRETGVVSSIDLAATVCALAGATPPSADGVDLSRLLDSRTAVRDAAYIEAPGNQWDGLRTGTFKYAERRTGGPEMYDLATDPFELVNVAASPAYAGTRAALATRLSTLRR